LSRLAAERPIVSLASLPTKLSCVPCCQFQRMPSIRSSRRITDRLTRTGYRSKITSAPGMLPRITSGNTAVSRSVIAVHAPTTPAPTA
jgi:hypothetical protein